jgi:hypothetical protein
MFTTPGSKPLRRCIMIIRTTTDPISLHDVPNPELHPCVFEGDGDNGIEIFFENEANRQTYLAMSVEERKVLKGNSAEDYVAEG